MTVPADPNTVQNAAAGQPLQAALLDAFRDYLLYLSTNRPHCRVYNSANISIPNTTATALTFNSERYDVGALHSTSSNTGLITCTDPGVYRLSAGVEFASNATGRRSLGLLLNGTTYIALVSANADAGGGHQLSVTTEYTLAAGNVVSVVVSQTSGSALNVSAIGNYSPEFSAYWLCV